MRSTLRIWSLATVATVALLEFSAVSATAQTATFDGEIEVNFIEHVKLDEFGNPQVDYFDFVSGSATVDLDVPFALDVGIASDAIGEEAVYWNNSFNWDSVPLHLVNVAEITPKIVEVVGAVESVAVPTVYTAVQDIDNLLEHSGPSERGFSAGFDLMSDDPGLENWTLTINAGVTIQFDVSLQSGADVLLNQTDVILQNLRVNNNAYLDGNNEGLTIREDLECHGTIDRLVADIARDLINAPSGDVQAVNLQVGGNLGNAGFLDVASLTVQQNLENVGTLLVQSGHVRGSATNSGQMAAGSTRVEGSLNNSGQLTVSGLNVDGEVSNGGEIILNGGLTTLQPFTNGSTIIVHSGSITCPGGWANSSKVILEGGTLGSGSGPDALDNNGWIDFLAGKLYSTGLDNSSGIITIKDGGAKTFYDFVNHGRIEHEFGEDASGSIINYGVIELSGSGGLGNVTNHNGGRVSKAGSSTAVISSLNNQPGGILEVRGGTLQVGGNSLYDGQYTINGTLHFGGNATIADNVTFGGGGTLRCDGGFRVVQNARLKISPGLTLETTTGLLDVAAGKTATLDGTFPWENGGIAGQVVIDSTAKLVASGEASRSLNATLTNRGTFEKTGPETTLIHLDGRLINDGGTLRVTSGTLQFDTSILATENLVDLYDGTYYVAGGSSLIFDGRERGLNLFEDVHFSGGGTVEVRSLLAKDNLTLSIDSGMDFNGYNNQQYDPGTLISTESGKTCTIAGKFRFGRGVINGNVVLAPGAVMELYSGGAKQFGSTFTNHGLVQHSIPYDAGFSGNFYNAEDGLYELSDAGGLVYTHPIARADMFYNQGTLRKTSDGVTTISTRFANEGGTIDVQAGELLFTSTPALHGGTYQLQGAAIDFAAGANLYEDLFFQGSGQVRGTTFNVHESLTMGFAPSVTFTGDIDGDVFKTDGGKTLTLTGPIAWKQGTISGDLILDADAAIEILDGGSKRLSGTTTNYGSLANTGTESVYLAGTLYNEPGGKIDLDGPGGINGGTLYNKGWITKRGDGSVTLPTLIQEAGTIQVLGGTLTAANPKLYGGSMTIFSGATLNLSNISLYGNVALSGGGTLLAANITAKEDARFDIGPGIEYAWDAGASGGYYSDEGKTLSISGEFPWKSGTIYGSVEFLTGSEITATGTGSKQVRGVLTNRGHLSVTDGSIGVVGSGQLINAGNGVFDISGSGSVGGRWRYMANEGLLRKTGSQTNSVACTLFNTGGDIEVYGGDLQFSGMRFDGGRILVDHGRLTMSGVRLANATIDLIDGEINLLSLQQVIGNTTITGTGTLYGDWDFTGATIMPGHSPGSIEFTGNLTMDETSRVVLEILGTEAGEYDQLLVGRNAVLNGVVEVQLVPGLQLDTGDQFPLLQADVLSGTYEIQLPELPGGDPLFSSSIVGDQWMITSLQNYLVLPEPYTLTSVADGHFHAAATWDDGELAPGVAARTIVQDHTVTVAEADRTDSLLVHQGGKLIVADGNTLTVNTEVEVTGASLELAPTGQLTADGPVTLGDGSVLVMELATAAAGQIDTANQVFLDPGSSLELVVSGKAPFTAGLYTLIQTTQPDGLSGEFGTSTDLGAYVAEGGLTYSGTMLTLTIGKNLLDGDADLSTQTDLSDFNIWNAHKFTAGTDWTGGDFNGDGATDLSDFNIWNANKFTSADGGAAPAPTEVPEPRTLGLLIAAMAICVVRRYRRRSV